MVRHEAAIFIWVVLGVGFLTGALPRAVPRRSALLPLGALVLFAGWTALGLTWTESEERTFEELTRVLFYVGLLTLAWSLLGRRTWRFAAAGLAVGAVIVVLLALGSRLYPDSFGRGEVAELFRTNRLGYPFDYWNGLAAWSAMAMAMALAWSAHARTLSVRAVSLAVVPACGVTEYLTYSRGGVGSVVVAAALALALSKNRGLALVHGLVAAAMAALAITEVRSHPEIAKGLGGAGAGGMVAVLLGTAAVCVAVVAITWFLKADRRLRLPERYGKLALVGVALATAAAVPLAAGPADDAWEEFKQPEQPVTTVAADPSDRLSSFGGARYDHWTSAVDSWESSPFEGSGPGTFEFWWNRNGGEQFVRDTHSLYLETLGESGLPGALLLIGALVGIAALGVRSRVRLKRSWEAGASAAVLAAFGVFLFHAALDWLWELTAVGALGLACGAVAVCATGTRRLRLGWPARAGLAAAALAAVLLQIPGLQSTSHVRESQAAFKAGDVRLAERRASEAIDSQGSSASAHQQRALVRESRGALAASRADLLEAIRLEPTNWRHRILLARVEVQLGDRRAALAAFRAGRRLRPASVYFELPPLVPVARPPGQG